MKTSHSELPALPEFIALREVRRSLGGASHATVAGLIADGILPKPIRPRRNLVLFEKRAFLQAIEALRAVA
jgi:hypothetical protein